MAADACAYRVTAHPTDGDAWHLLGAALLTEGKWTAAHREWRSGAAAAPRHRALLQQQQKELVTQIDLLTVQHTAAQQCWDSAEQKVAQLEVEQKYTVQITGELEQWKQKYETNTTPTKLTTEMALKEVFDSSVRENSLSEASEGLDVDDSDVDFIPHHQDPDFIHRLRRNIQPTLEQRM